MKVINVTGGGDFVKAFGEPLIIVSEYNMPASKCLSAVNHVSGHRGFCKR